MTPIPRRTAGPRTSTRSRRPWSVGTDADLARIRANVTFWGDRFTVSPRDFISATRLAASEIELARATGDIGAYVAAGAAVDGALKAYEDYPLALDYRGVIQVALHQFAAARANAEAILAEQPGRRDRDRDARRRGARAR